MYVCTTFMEKYLKMICYKTNSVISYCLCIHKTWKLLAVQMVSYHAFTIWFLTAFSA